MVIKCVCDVVVIKWHSSVILLYLTTSTFTVVLLDIVIHADMIFILEIVIV